MKRNIPSIIAGLTLALTILAPAVAAAQNVDYASSAITFVSKQMNVPVAGRFGRFSASIAFDPAKPAAGKATIEVDLASIDTGSSEANTEVARKAWFNLAAFPTARFVSESVRQVGPGSFEARGRLSIKGIGHEVVAPFTVKPGNGTAIYEGSFTLQRLAYNIGEGVWSDTETVADEVQVKFRIVASRSK